MSTWWFEVYAALDERPVATVGTWDRSGRIVEVLRLESI